MAPINDEAFPGDEFVDALEAGSSPPRIAAGNDACDLFEINLAGRGRREVGDVTRKNDTIRLTQEIAWKRAGRISQDVHSARLIDANHHITAPVGSKQQPRLVGR
ncbi:hypothetical protein [Sphingopyxis sp. 113P3]|uniref:hypothetical protein n=1 Tax=Sphingopyxis sp. (strain 113P3) TaxID=292913 RepID=UPI00130E9AFB|nr:hypothetical protein [Sphingopyxis sp. 113P3]